VFCEFGPAHAGQAFAHACGFHLLKITRDEQVLTRQSHRCRHHPDKSRGASPRKSLPPGLPRSIPQPNSAKTIITGNTVTLIATPTNTTAVLRYRSRAVHFQALKPSSHFLFRVIPRISYPEAIFPRYFPECIDCEQAAGVVLFVVELCAPAGSSAISSGANSRGGRGAD